VIDKRKIKILGQNHLQIFDNSSDDFGTILAVGRPQRQRNDSIKINSQLHRQHRNLRLPVHSLTNDREQSW